MPNECEYEHYTSRNHQRRRSWADDDQDTKRVTGEPTERSSEWFTDRSTESLPSPTEGIRPRGLARSPPGFYDALVGMTITEKQSTETLLTNDYRVKKHRQVNGSMASYRGLPTGTEIPYNATL
jgi:hypothetical protein